MKTWCVKAKRKNELILSSHSENLCKFNIRIFFPNAGHEAMFYGCRIETLCEVSFDKVSLGNPD